MNTDIDKMVNEDEASQADSLVKGAIVTKQILIQPNARLGT